MLPRPQDSPVAIEHEPFPVPVEQRDRASKVELLASVIDQKLVRASVEPQFAVRDSDRMGAGEDPDEADETAERVPRCPGRRCRWERGVVRRACGVIGRTLIWRGKRSAV